MLGSLCIQLFFLCFFYGTSGRASELHVCFSIDNGFSPTYSFRKHISYAPSSYESVITQSSAELNLSYPNMTLLWESLPSQVQHHMAMHCTMHCLIYSQLLTTMHEVRHDAVSIATPCIGFQSIKVLTIACKLQIIKYLLQLVIAMA